MVMMTTMTQIKGLDIIGFKILDRSLGANWVFNIRNTLSSSHAPTTLIVDRLGTCKP